MYFRGLSLLLVLGMLAVAHAGSWQVREVDSDFLELMKARELLNKRLYKRGHEGSCLRRPCKHGGHCVHIPSRFQTSPGLDYHCVCQGNFGGFFCEIRDPCSTCPDFAHYCVRTAKDKTGCYCF